MAVNILGNNKVYTVAELDKSIGPIIEKYDRKIVTELPDPVPVPDKTIYYIEKNGVYKAYIAIQNPSGGGYTWAEWNDSHRPMSKTEVDAIWASN